MRDNGIKVAAGVAMSAACLVGALAALRTMSGIWTGWAIGDWHWLA